MWKSKTRPRERNTKITYKDWGKQTSKQTNNQSIKCLLPRDLWLQGIPITLVPVSHSDRMLLFVHLFNACSHLYCSPLPQLPSTFAVRFALEWYVFSITGLRSVAAMCAPHIHLQRVYGASTHILQSRHTLADVIMEITIAFLWHFRRIEFQLARCRIQDNFFLFIYLCTIYSSIN